MIRGKSRSLPKNVTYFSIRKVERKRDMYTICDCTYTYTWFTYPIVSSILAVYSLPESVIYLRFLSFQQGYT